MAMTGLKIIVTIGPSSAEKGILKKMIENGASAVRINTAHVDTSYLSYVRKIIDEINDELNSHVGMLVDLKGPELRVSTIDHETVTIHAGMHYNLYEQTGGEISLNRENVISLLKPGIVIKMSDGRLSFRVKEVFDDHCSVEAMLNGNLRDNSRVNIPGVPLNLGVLTERDRRFIREGVKNRAEYFAMSFVQQQEDVLLVEEEIRKRGGRGEIIAKIETLKGYENIREIAEVSEMIMVARGDLGVELPLAEIGIAQKHIIRVAHNLGRPAILATQILESMVDSPEPTRAEISDVTNAVIDNTDVLMLSEETAIGKYPARSVKYLQRISGFALRSIGRLTEPETYYGNEVTFAICRSAKMVADMIDASGIIAFTRRGNTAKMLSVLRTGRPVYAVVTDTFLARKLNLLYGVRPVLLSSLNPATTNLKEVLKVIYGTKLFMSGRRYVLVSGLPYFLFGGTNDVRVVTMGEYMGRGYPFGPDASGHVVFSEDGEGNILVVDSRSCSGDLSKFKGVIFTDRPPRICLKTLLSMGVALLIDAQFSMSPKKGDKIMWDSKSGIITRVSS